MTTDPSPRALLARLGATEPRAGEIVSEVRTEAMLPFFHDLAGGPAPAGIKVTGTLSAIIAVTATLPWQRAAQLQDWLTDRRKDDALATNETELADFVADTIFAGGDLAGTARYLGTYIVAGRAQRTVRMMIGLTGPVSEAQYAAAWARALAETKAVNVEKFARLRGFLALLLDGEGVTVEKQLLLSAIGDLIGHSIASGPAGG